MVRGVFTQRPLAANKRRYTNREGEGYLGGDHVDHHWFESPRPLGGRYHLSREKPQYLPPICRPQERPVRSIRCKLQRVSTWFSLPLACLLQSLKLPKNPQTTRRCWIQRLKQKNEHFDTSTSRSKSLQHFVLSVLTQRSCVGTCSCFCMALR